MRESSKEASYWLRDEMWGAWDRREEVEPISFLAREFGMRCEKWEGIQGKLLFFFFLFLRLGGVVGWNGRAEFSRYANYSGAIYYPAAITCMF